MASAQFQDNQTTLNEMFYESHKALVERVCMALNQVDKAEEITTLLLGEKMKLKFKRDPNKPKKPKSGFLFFCDELRPGLISKEKSKNKKIIIGDIAKELGKRWAKLKVTDKERYDKMKETDKVRYTTAMEAYNNKLYSLN
tara:strand:- start:60 stop:482 length:423 start_codon:yes stop_codon:yes gene_type:complete